MVVGLGPRLVLQEQVQVADLVQNNGGVNHSWFLYLVKLLNSVVFLQVKAEYSIRFLTSLSQTSNQQNFSCRNFNGSESTDRGRYD